MSHGLHALMSHGLHALMSHGIHALMSCALQVSFVNSIATSKGGTHVNALTDQVSRHQEDIDCCFGTS